MDNQNSPHWSELFIGREQELTWLRRIWTEAKSHEPRFCVLRGESGFGKTKIIQKFYSEISTSSLDDPNHYWPDTLLQEQNNLRVNPKPTDFKHNAEIPWLWWGIRWTTPDERNQSEMATCGLLANLDHLKPHQEAFESYQKSRNRLIDTITDGASIAGAVTDVATLGGVGTLKSLWTLGKAVHGEWKEQEKQKLTIEQRQELAEQARLEILMSFFQQMLITTQSSTKPLPIILVLDDAQWIDSASVLFIQQLMSLAIKNHWPLLILATHWEQDWNLNNPTTVQNKLPWLYQQLKTSETETCSIVDIDRMAGLNVIIMSAFPGLAEDQISFLLDRSDGNPRLLQEIILELSSEPYYFQQQDLKLALTEEALLEMQTKSFALHEVQTRRFRRMSKSLQTLLSYASYQGMRFLKDLVIQLAEQLDNQSEQDKPEQTLASAIHPYATIIESSAIIYEFRHRVFYDLAKQRIDKFPSLTRNIEIALIELGQQWYQQERHLQLTDDEKESFYLLILKTLENHQTDSSLQRDLLCELLLMYNEQGYFAKAIPWLDLLETVFKPVSTAKFTSLPFWTQIELLRLLQQLNHWSLAESIANDLYKQTENLAKINSSSEQQQRERLIIEFEIGKINLAQDQQDKALELYRASLTTCEQIIARFGESAESLLDVSISQERVADILLKQDQLDKALVLFRESITNRKQIISRFGESVERLRAYSCSQLHVAEILLQQDQVDKALTLFQKSLTTSEQIIARFGESAERLRDVSISQLYVADSLLKLMWLHFFGQLFTLLLLF